MAAEQKMHSPGSPPAAESRAAHTCVLDLTSWCVKSGSVQLPSALLGRFGAGRVVAQSDGGELSLELVPPRTLAGFTDYFSVHGLKANDALRFEFATDGLRITAQRRDRSRPAPGADRASATPVAGTGAQLRAAGTANPATPRRRASDWAEAIEREEARSAAARGGQAAVDGGDKVVPSIKVERFAGAVEDLAPSQPRRRRTDQLPRSEPAAAPVATDRLVDQRVKVRIEGGIPAQTGNGDVRPKDRLSAHNVWARRENPQWHSLDPVQAANDPEAARDPDFPDTVVRAYRRSANGSLRDESLAAPRAADGAARPGHEPRFSSAPAARSAPTQRGGERRVVGAGAAWSHAASQVSAVDEAVVAPVRRAQAPEPAPMFDPAAAAHEEDVAAPAPVRGSRLNVMSRIGLRLGIGRERAPGGRGGGQVSPGDDHAAAPDPLPAPRFVSRPAGGPPLGAGSAPAPQARRLGVASPTAVEDALIDADIEALGALRAPRHDGGAARGRVDAIPAATASVEDDVSFLEAFLMRPGTPAIVRSLDLAERLGMSPERVARAMERLSEQRERVSRIKEGAYMVRQKRA